MNHASANSFALILLYHGVTDSASLGIENFSKKHVPAPLFDAQMKYLAENANLMSLRNLSACIKTGDVISPKTAAVTFDDSFKNVHDVALPILKQYGVPATFFITTGFVNSNRLFWVDQVEHLINLTNKTNIEVNLNGIVQCFSLQSSKQIIDAIIRIKNVLKLVKPKDRKRILVELGNVTEVSLETALQVPNYSMLTWDDVRNLDDRRSGYDVGAHGVNHEVLSMLTDEELQFEISQSINDLELRLGHSIDLFSYPEGQP
jgi:peptidoglycan/xylan/chitin deacetylase (PgdA/CDA1 family)